LSFELWVFISGVTLVLCVSWIRSGFLLGFNCWENQCVNESTQNRTVHIFVAYRCMVMSVKILPYFG
jgi:hypothetical protein